MRQHCLLAIIFAILASCLSSIVKANNTAEITNQETKLGRTIIEGGNRFLRTSKEPIVTESDALISGQEDEERVGKLSGLGHLKNLFQKSSIALEKNFAQAAGLKKPSALAASLERNPTLVKDLSKRIDQNPGLVTRLMNSPAFNRLQTTFSKNPSQKKTVEQIGATVAKRQGKGTNWYFVFGIVVVLLGMAGTVGVTAYGLARN